MAVKSGTVSFKDYLIDVVNKMYDSESMYEGNIKEERINGQITQFSINLTLIKENNNG